MNHCGNKSSTLYICVLGVVRLGTLILIPNSMIWPNMDPADPEDFHLAILQQGALLGKHNQILQDLSTNLQEISRSLSQAAPAPPILAPSPPIPSCEPFVLVLEFYNGDLGSCQLILVQCSLVFEQQPLTYPTDRFRIAYLIGA